MAPEAAVDQPSSPSTGTHDCSDSIINRKREHRGLTSGFSSNLGRPQTSFAQAHQGNDAASESNGNSVKAIIAWIESSKQKSTTVERKTLEASRSKPRTSTFSPRPAPRVIQQPVQMPPGVEEYSLTLLRYRQYFTEMPLGRCLDGSSTKDKLPDGRIRGETSFTTTRPPVREVKDSCNKRERGDSRPPGEKKSQEPRVDNEDTLKTSQSSNSSTLANPTPPIQRHPHEVDAFWKHVQGCLWISDEELEDDIISIHSQAEACQPIGGAPPLWWDSASRNDDRAPSNSSTQSLLDWQTHSSPSVSSMDWKMTRRKRLLSTEEKISELDAFFDEDGPRDSQEILSPAQAAAQV